MEVLNGKKYAAHSESLCVTTLTRGSRAGDLWYLLSAEAALSVLPVSHPFAGSITFIQITTSFWDRRTQTDIQTLPHQIKSPVSVLCPLLIGRPPGSPFTARRGVGMFGTGGSSAHLSLCSALSRPRRRPALWHRVQTSVLAPVLWGRKGGGNKCTHFVSYKEHRDIMDLHRYIYYTQVRGDMRQCVQDSVLGWLYVVQLTCVYGFCGCLCRDHSLCNGCSNIGVVV